MIKKMASNKTRVAFEWNIETTKLLITLYEENEVLYNHLHPNYKDRNKRLALLVKFSNIISETTGKICLVADVRKKISNLRSQYLAEKLKIIKTKSGTSGDIYKPSAYWFPLLKFLESVSTADESKTNLDDLDDSENCSLETQDLSDTEALCGKPPQTKKIKKRCHDDSELLIREATTTMRNMCQLATKKSTNSNIDSFCQFVASELNSILDCSSITYVKRAKRDIQKVLFNIWDEIDENQRVSSLKNYSFKDSSLVQKNDPEIDADYKASSLKNYSLKDSFPVQKNDPEIDADQRASSQTNYLLKDSSPVQNDPEVDADQRVSSMKNYSFQDSSLVQKNDFEIDADQRASSRKNYSFKDSSPGQNDSEVDAGQRASSLKNSFKDSSSVQKNDPESNYKNYSVDNSVVLRNDISRNFTTSNNTPVTIPVSVTKKISGKPNIIILKKKHYKSKPKYTITAAASEEIVIESDQYGDNVQSYFENWKTENN